MFHTSVVLQYKLLLTNDFKHIQNNKVTGLIKDTVDQGWQLNTAIECQKKDLGLWDFSTTKPLNFNAKYGIACWILYNYVLFGGVPLNDQEFSPKIPNLHDAVVSDAVDKAKRRRFMDHLVNLQWGNFKLSVLKHMHCIFVAWIHVCIMNLAIMEAFS